MEHKFKAVALLAAWLLSANTAQASHISVGTCLVYDNVPNVTRSSDANLFATTAACNTNPINYVIVAVPTVHDTPNGYGTPANSGNYNPITVDFNTAGYATWSGTMAWAQYLDGINYLGHYTWMQPTTYVQTCSGYNCTNSTLNELFYTGLSGVAGTSITTTHKSSYGHVQNSGYWFGTKYAANLDFAWYFYTDIGYQDASYKVGYILYSWDVLSGE
ncbi:MAG: hypothetical protein ACYCZR_00655 [Burkholderiales bacterium]